MGFDAKLINVVLSLLAATGFYCYKKFKFENIKYYKGELFLTTQK